MIKIDDTLFPIFPLNKHFCLQRDNSVECSFGGNTIEDISQIVDESDSDKESLSDNWESDSSSEGENDNPGEYRIFNVRGTEIDDSSWAFDEATSKRTNKKKSF